VLRTLRADAHRDGWGGIIFRLEKHENGRKHQQLVVAGGVETQCRLAGGSGSRDVGSELALVFDDGREIATRAGEPGDS
jgi:hypothetical protein